MSFTKPTMTEVTIPLKPIKLQPQALLEIDDVVSEFEETLEEDVLKEAKRLHDELITRAKQECQQLLLDATKKAEVLQKEAYDEAYQNGLKQGYDDGMKAGHEAMNQEAIKVIETLKHDCYRAQQDSRDYIDSISTDLVSVVKLTVEKITYQVLEETESQIVPLIMNQLKDLHKRQQLFIRVHPESFEAVQTYEPQFLQWCPETKIHLIKDVTLSSFGCVLETETETIDLQIDKQLNVLFKALTEVVNTQ